MENFKFLGVEIDEARNEKNARQISSDTSKVGVLVIQTQEDFSIISQSLALSNKGGTQ